MKGLIVLAAALLVGCAPVKTLEELELAALQSGDWSAVEDRERVLKERRTRLGIDCPNGLVPVCENFASQSRCHCGSRRYVEDLLSRF